VGTLPGADIDCDKYLVLANIFTRLKKIIKLTKEKPKRDVKYL
jgi:hypothetical protein